MDYDQLRRRLDSKAVLSPATFFYSAPRVIERGFGTCPLYKHNLHLKTFQMFASEYFEVCYASTTDGTTSYVIIAVY